MFWHEARIILIALGVVKPYKPAVVFGEGGLPNPVAILTFGPREANIGSHSCTDQVCGLLSLIG